MKSFASDNWSGACPEVMAALTAVNHAHAPGYGDDATTQDCTELFQKLLGKEVAVYYLTNGTAANVLALKSLLKSYEGVVTSEESHIHTDECGAMEAIAGNKILTVSSHCGKIKTNDILPYLHCQGNIQKVQPRVIEIAQLTERETVYSLEEIQAICDFAHMHHMVVYMDGARIANAAAVLDCSLKEMTVDCGVDVFSFGGTKNGAMMGEALVFVNTALAEDFAFVQKQGMQIHSKNRFIAAQIKALLENDIWIKNGRKANAMADYFRTNLRQIQIPITIPSEANGIYCLLPGEVIEPLQQKYPFHIWNEPLGEVRLVTSFDTTAEEIDGFIRLYAELIAQ